MHCYFCHGYGGDARTVAARYLKPPPRDFTAPAARRLNAQDMRRVVAEGKPGTAMQGFAHRLSQVQINLIVDYVRTAFISGKPMAAVTRYHSMENGWRDHARRYGAAYPFVTGELSLATPPENLTREQTAGRILFLSSCITCHDRGDGAITFSPRPLSFPRNGVTPATIDTISGATLFAKHDVSPPAAPANLRKGESLFQQNCKMCHGADGSGRNWIGQFIEPHAADLRDINNLSVKTRDALRARIGDGVPGSAMPAWRYVLDGDQLDAVASYICGAIVRKGQCDDRPRLRQKGDKE